MEGGSCPAWEEVSSPMNGLVVGAAGSNEWEVWNRKVVGGSGMQGVLEVHFVVIRLEGFG